MSILDALIDGAAAKAERSLAKVVAFAVTVARHTDKQGRKSMGFKVYPMLSDGQPARFGDLWIRISEGPDALRALVDSVPSILAAADALDRRMVEAGEWPARVDAKVEAKPKQAKPKPDAKPSVPAPKRSVLDDLLDEGLPS